MPSLDDHDLIENPPPWPTTSDELREYGLWLERRLREALAPPGRPTLRLVEAVDTDEDDSA